MSQAALLEQLLALPSAERLEALKELNDVECLALLYDWEGLWARPAQREPKSDPTWLFWFLCGGRGSGKTRPAAEWVKSRALSMPGSRGFIAARTLDDVRLTCIEGDSGVLSCLEPSIGKKWNRTTCELTIRVGDDGTKIKGFTSEKPAQGRGPQHHWGWADEFAAWLKDGELWDQLMFGLRLPWEGREAQAVLASTPLPIKRVRNLFDRENKLVKTAAGISYTDVVISRMTTYDNMENLAATYLAIVQQHEGTRLGQQELLGKLLEDTPGALWQRSWFDRPGFRIKITLEDIDYLVVAADPAITAHEKEKGDENDSDLTGIVAGGRLKRGSWLDSSGKADPNRDHYVVLAERSDRLPPADWARSLVGLYDEVKADHIVGETNRGGDLVEAVIRQQMENAPFIGVNASRGKHTRAEPIATMYEQGRVHHALMGRNAKDILDGVGENDQHLIHLEDELCTWVPWLADSPDRLDADVWMLTAALDGARVWVK